MDKKERQFVAHQLNAFDQAEEAIHRLRRQYDDALARIDEAREEFLGHYDWAVVGTCETCQSALFEGDDGYNDGEVMFCEEHAPTWGDVQSHAAESSADDWEFPEDRDNCLNAVKEYLAEGGDLTDKRVWKL